MSHRLDEKQARRAERQRHEEQARRAEQSQRWVRRGGYGAVGLIAATLVMLAVVLGGGGGTPAHDMLDSTGGAAGVGATAPDFTLTDVVSNAHVTRDSLAGRKTLLFFSEGVMCQACFEQIKGLERMGDVLERRGIQLVSITPDPAPDLAQAIGQYGVATPMIADDDRDMSRAFNTLGQGMHGDTPGHAFVLVERGKVLWQRDYWLAPYRTMYVEPKQLLDDIPSA
jgi:peroxiredoxin Q/BCP